MNNIKEENIKQKTTPINMKDQTNEPHESALRASAGNAGFTRRSAIKLMALGTAIGVAGAFGVLGCDVFKDSRFPLIKPEARWTTTDLSAFLKSLNKDEQNLVLLSLYPDPAKEKFDVTKIKKEILYKASSIATYPFKNKEDYYYHNDIVRWLAGKYNVSGDLIQSASTFVLERKIFEEFFKETWDSLKPEKRREVLKNIPDDKLSATDKAAIAAVGGGAALLALSTTVALTGFTFYTTMSSILCALGASIAGFSAYTTASSAVAAVTGPVGWCVGALAVLGGALYISRANPTKTAAVVIQLHLIKMQILQNSGKLENTLKNLGLKN